MTVGYLSLRFSPLTFIKRKKCYPQLPDTHILEVSKFEALTKASLCGQVRRVFRSLG